MANMRKLSKQKTRRVLDTLYGTASGFTGKDATVQFIQTLLTESEQLTVGRRIVIAQMLLAGKTRSEICSEIGVSPNTCALTRTWLHERMSQYDKARTAYMERQREPAAKRREKFRMKDWGGPSTFIDLRKKYPGHFLLFNFAEWVFTTRPAKKRNAE